MTKKNRTSRPVAIVLLTILILAAAPALAGGNSFTAKVKAVTDGDTILVSRGGNLTVVQLAGIDAPELGQPYGADAKRYLNEQLLKQKVTIHEIERTGPTTVVARVTLGEQDIALQMVETGLAWIGSGERNDALEAAQRIARSEKDGLWAGADPTPPWTYRETQGQRG